MKNQFELKYTLDLEITGVTFNFGIVDYSPAEEPTDDCPGEAEMHESHYVINIDQQDSIDESKAIAVDIQNLDECAIQLLMVAEYKNKNSMDEYRL